jgi:hypothetical protein
LWLALAVSLPAIGCNDGAGEDGFVAAATASTGPTPASGSATAGRTAAGSSARHQPSAAGSAGASGSASPSRAGRGGALDRAAACAAPSLQHNAEIDGHDQGALEPCVMLKRPPTMVNKQCGERAVTPAKLDHLNASVMPLDPLTTAHLREVAKRGREQGRKPRVFAVAGDSMTVSPGFMRPFGLGKEDFILRDDVRAALSTPVDQRSDTTIIDYYHAQAAANFYGRIRDSFHAPRLAAKVGVRTEWLLAGGGESPAAKMVRLLSPGVVVVLFGGNDAAYRSGDPASVADDWEADMTRVIEHFEKQGIIVVLNTLARHADSPGISPCGGEGKMGDWRVAVQTNAVSRRAVELACKRRLPLIDVRHALDAVPHHGLISDGIHPSHHAKGTMHFNDRGLSCGYNIRNYVTLLMLKQIKESVFDRL